MSGCGPGRENTNFLPRVWHGRGTASTCLRLAFGPGWLAARECLCVQKLLSQRDFIRGNSTHRILTLVTWTQLGNDTMHTPVNSKHVCM